MSSDQIEEFHQNVQEKYIDSLVTQLEDHFPDSAELVLFTLFDPSKLPESPSELRTYEKDKVRNMLEVRMLISRWESFKYLLFGSNRKYSMQSMLKASATTHSTIATLYPSLSKLPSITLVLPLSTAECE